MSDPSPDPSASSAGAPAPTPRRALVFFLLALGVLALYPAARWVVRQYTSGLIADVEGRRLPEFTLAGNDGRLYSPAALAGKPAVLNFFRSRCHGCQAEQADIRALAAEIHPERATMLGVMVDRVQGFPAAVTDKTLAELDYRHPILMADPAFVDAFHGAGWSQITPITYVVDAKGRVLRSFRHPYSFDDLRAAIPE